MLSSLSLFFPLFGWKMFLENVEFVGVKLPFCLLQALQKKKLLSENVYIILIGQAQFSIYISGRNQIKNVAVEKLGTMFTLMSFCFLMMNNLTDFFLSVFTIFDGQLVFQCES